MFFTIDLDAAAGCQSCPFSSCGGTAPASSAAPRRRRAILGAGAAHVARLAGAVILKPPFNLMYITPVRAIGFISLSIQHPYASFVTGIAVRQNQGRRAMPSRYPHGKVPARPRGWIPPMTSSPASKARYLKVKPEQEKAIRQMSSPRSVGCPVHRPYGKLTTLKALLGISGSSAGVDVSRDVDASLVHQARVTFQPTLGCSMMMVPLDSISRRSRCFLGRRRPLRHIDSQT